MSNIEIALKMISSGTQQYSHVVIEMFNGYGMPVSEYDILTVLWIGVFTAIAMFINNCKVSLVFRKTVVSELCHSSKAGDPEVTRRMKDIYGEPGTKKNPGTLYGIKSHAWQALGLATAWEDIYPTGELGYMTLLPDGRWEDQKTRDANAAERKQVQDKKRAKRKAAREEQEEKEKLMREIKAEFEEEMRSA